MCNGQCVYQYYTWFTCCTPCPYGQTCSYGICLPDCPISGQTKCGDTCVDMVTDPYNCGTCGNACASCTHTCSGGQCVPTGLQWYHFDWGFGSIDLCLDPTVADCNCGWACPYGTSCVNGQCVTTCAAGTTLCGAACVDTSSDSTNCGTCGNACGSYQYCSGGTCISSGGGGGGGGWCGYRYYDFYYTDTYYYDWNYWDGNYYYYDYDRCRYWNIPAAEREDTNAHLMAAGARQADPFRRLLSALPTAARTDADCAGSPDGPIACDGHCVQPGALRFVCCGGCGAGEVCVPGEHRATCMAAQVTVLEVRSRPTNASAARLSLCGPGQAMCPVTRSVRGADGARRLVDASCANLDSDADNCGACGKSCDRCSERCEAGACVPAGGLAEAPPECAARSECAVPGEARDPVTGACACPAGTQRERVGAGSVCQKVCPAGYVPDGRGGCECPEGTDEVGGWRCETACAPPRVRGKDGVCRCDVAGRGTAACLAAPCRAPRVPSADGSACECPAGTADLDGAGRCLPAAECAAGRVRLPGSADCVCPSGAVVAADGSCRCPLGSTALPTGECSRVTRDSCEQECTGCVFNEQRSVCACSDGFEETTGRGGRAVCAFDCGGVWLEDASDCFLEGPHPPEVLYPVDLLEGVVVAEEGPGQVPAVPCWTGLMSDAYADGVCPCAEGYARGAPGEQCLARAAGSARDRDRVRAEPLETSAVDAFPSEDVEPEVCAEGEVATHSFPPCCPAGREPDGEGACRPCAKGRAFSESSRRCEPLCSDGQYFTGLASTPCCALGEAPAGGGVCAPCPRGRAANPATARCEPVDAQVEAPEPDPYEGEGPADASAELDRDALCAAGSPDACGPCSRCSGVRCEPLRGAAFAAYPCCGDSDLLKPCAITKTCLAEGEWCACPRGQFYSKETGACRRPDAACARDAECGACARCDVGPTGKKQCLALDPSERGRFPCCGGALPFSCDTASQCVKDEASCPRR
jgi:hypothetical protein